MSESVDGRRSGSSLLAEDATGHAKLVAQLVALWASMLQRWRGIAVIVGIMLAMVAAYLAVTPARFSASAMVLINSKNFSGQREPTAVAMDMAALSANIESQVEILKSDRILRQVVESEQLANDPFMQSGMLRAAITRVMAIVRRQQDAAREERRILTSMRALHHLTKVKRLGNTHLVEIEVTLGDPLTAARVANSYAQTYVEDQRRLREDLLKQSSDALGVRARELREQARAAEEAVEKYKFNSATQGKDGAEARVVLKDLESQARTFRIIHDKFLERYAEALQQQQSVVPDAQLISAATPPLSKSWPNTMVLIATALFLGLLLSALWTLIMDQLQATAQQQPSDQPPWGRPFGEYDQIRPITNWINQTLGSRGQAKAGGEGATAESATGTFGSHVLLKRLRRAQEQNQK